MPQNEWSGSIEKIEMVYDRLADEESQFIFQNRLMYSQLGDRRFIREMVMGLMERHGDDDVIRCLQKWIEERNQEIAVFGAGFAACQIIETLRELGIQTGYLIDNDSRLWGLRRYGMEILSPDTFFGLKAPCGIIIGVNHFVDDIYRQILDYGINPNDIYRPVRQWWMGKDAQYFDSEIMVPVDCEIFIDGGALDGTDSIHFIDWCKGKYDGIYAFEPDGLNYGKLMEAGRGKKNFFACQKGLWDRSTELGFSSGNGESSRISKEGKTRIKAVSIDEELKGLPVTFVKMDIEGSELKALCGAEKTIREYKPRLAICVYHGREDILEIPFKVLEFYPGYRLYLRHYSYVDTETVLYAV